MRLICINDTNRPENIPASKWVKKGEIYTLKYIKKLSDGSTGVMIHEIDLIPYFPYQFFASSRFVVHPEDIENITNADVEVDEEELASV